MLNYETTDDGADWEDEPGEAGAQGEGGEPQSGEPQSGEPQSGEPQGGEPQGGELARRLSRYCRQRSCPLSSPKQWCATVRMTTFWIVENCRRVAFSSASTRASAPMPGEVMGRQNCIVAVPGSGV